MALYFGNSKVRINLKGIPCGLHIITEMTPAPSTKWLLSSDGFVLRDSTGVYLIPGFNNVLLSLDNRILADANGLYLASKEGN